MCGAAARVQLNAPVMCTPSMSAHCASVVAVTGAIGNTYTISAGIEPLA